MDTPSSSQNPWFAVAVGLIGVIVGYGVGTLQYGSAGPSRPIVAQNEPVVPPPPPPPPPPAGPLPEIDTNTDHVRGNKNAKIAIVEYSDFECPFCKRHVPTMEQVLDTYGDDVMVVYRHFPLSFHPFAQKAAEASECAAELGGNDGFWKMHDALFAVEQLSDTAITGAAKTAGLNEKPFADCLSSGRHAQKVQDQMDGGAAAGVQGTPGNFIVNLDTDEQREISGAVPFSTFKSAIDQMLGS